MRRLRMEQELSLTGAVWVDRLSTGLGLTWLALIAATTLLDEFSQLPPRHPTAAERASSTPKALEKWRIVYPQLAQRLGYAPPEFGAVWASRSGRICGVVTLDRVNTYFREPFYTEGTTPYFARDDDRRFLRAWVDCVGDHWVNLRTGSDEIGFCAVPSMQRSVLGRAICKGSNQHAGYGAG